MPAPESFSSLVYGRHSTRAYLPTPVADELLRELVMQRARRLAAPTCNRVP